MRLVVAAALALLASNSFANCEGSLLNHSEKRLLGKTENLCEQYAGKVVLVVNTASACGYTPQYEGLEALYKQYKDKGLVVLGFPSNQFGEQEKGSSEEIAKFCKANFGVSFPMFAKTEVKGDSANPLYQGLIAATGETPAWNFNKYLIGRDGKAVVHYGSKVTPLSEDLVKAVEVELAR